MSKDVGTAVFVGNIPHDATEMSMTAEFSMIGTVNNFSIVTDRESGQPKGFGFCYFADIESARSAVRQMDRIQFRGRTLRVALADEAAAGGEQADIKPGAAAALTASGPRTLTEQDHVDIVASAVNLLTHQQRVEFLAQMKVFMQQHPHHATALLLQNPSLAQLLLHIEVLLDMVKPSDMAEVQAVFQQQQQLQQQQQQPPPQPQQPQHSQQPAPPQSSRAPPPVAASSASASLIVTPAIAAALGLSAAQVQQTQMFLDMAPDDLAKLPAPVQDQIRMLRARIVELVSRR